jgi:hypothetical protein
MDGCEWLPRTVRSGLALWSRPRGPVTGRSGRPTQECACSPAANCTPWAMTRPAEFIGQRVIVVGGGNSAAQILAEVSAATQTGWVTVRKPRFMPDEVDGRALFAAARERILARQQGGDHPRVHGLGDIVMIASVRAARERSARPAAAPSRAAGPARPAGLTTGAASPTRPPRQPIHRCKSIFLAGFRLRSHGRGPIRHHSRLHRTHSDFACSSTDAFGDSDP